MFLSLAAVWCPPSPVFDLGRAGRSLPPPSAVSAGGGSCFPLWGGRRSAGRPPPQLLFLLAFFLAVGVAVLYLPVAKAKDVHTLDYPKDKFKTAAKVVSGGVRVVSVRVLAGGVLSVWVRWAVLVVPPRRRGVLPPLLHLLPLPGGHGLLLSVVGDDVGVDVGVQGWLPLAGMPVLPLHRRLPCLWAVALPPLSPPRRGIEPRCRRRSGRRGPPRFCRARGRARGRWSPWRQYMSRG